MIDITGSLYYEVRTYTILPDPQTPPRVASPGQTTAQPVRPAEADEFTVAAVVIDDFSGGSGTIDTDNKTSLAVRNILRAPAVIALRNVPSLDAIQALADKINNDAIAAGQPNIRYDHIYQHNQSDLAFLLQRAGRIGYEVWVEGKEALFTKPSTGMSEPLFEHPPLLLRVTLSASDGSPFPITVIGVQVQDNADVGDPYTGADVREQRRAQAEFLANLVQSRQTADPNERIVSIGDFNAFQFNDGYVDVIGTLKGTPTPPDQVVLASADLVNPDLINLVDRLPSDQRYTFTFDGNAQTLDHALITQNMLPYLRSTEVARNNADFPETFRNDPNRPERFSDRDPLVVYFSVLTEEQNVPVARIVANPNPAACNQIVSFDGSSSYHQNPARRILSWAWDLDNDGQFDDATGPQVARAFPAYGTYSVALAVTDDNVPAKTDTESLVLEVNQGNQPPVPNAGGPYLIDLGDGVTLDASGSTDPNAGCGDSITRVEWDINNDGTYDFTLTPPEPPRLILTAADLQAYGLTQTATPYTIKLRVTDEFAATSTATTTLTIYNNQPVAVATANPNPAACSQPITFDGSSSSHGRPDRSIVKYEWDFNYNASIGFTVGATGPQASHVYDRFGTYTVALQVTDNNTPAKTDTETMVVDVNQGNRPPVAHAGGPYAADLGTAVTLNGTASSDPDLPCGDSIVSYGWVIAPGPNQTTLDGPMPTLTAAQVDSLGVGTYPVRLTVRDTFGAAGSAETTLSIYDNRPVASFSANPDPGICDQPVTFDARTSSHGRPDRAIVQYEWDFDGDGQLDLVVADGGPYTFRFRLAGVYQTRLTVVDNNMPPISSRIERQFTVQIENLPPVADAGRAYSLDVGSDLVLDASASSDPNASCGDTLTYAWDLDNDGAFGDAVGARPIILWPTIQSLGWRYPADPATGLPNNAIRLRVTDTFGLTSDASATVSIFLNEPIATATANPNPAACGQTIMLDGSSSSHGRPDRSIVKYEWDFNYNASIGFTVGATGPQASHVYDRFGNYTVALQVTDNNTPPKTDTETIVLDVNQGNRPPVAHAGGPYAADLGAAVTLDGTASSDPDAACGDSIVSYEWLVEPGPNQVALDGSMPTLTAAHVDSLGLGTHTVRLTVRDAFGATGLAETTLRIYDNRPFPSFSANPNPAACGQTITLDGSSSSHGRPDRSIVTYEWDFNYNASMGFSTAATGPQVTHPYAAFGTYTVALRVTDNNSPPKTAIATAAVAVNQGNRPPIAQAGGPYQAEMDASFALDGSGSSDPDAACGDTLTYAWDLDNDGTFDDATGATPAIPWAAVQSLGLRYPADPRTGLPNNAIRLRVTDSFGLSSAAATTLAIFDRTLPTVTVLAPAGGEIFTAGTPITIRFTGSDNDALSSFLVELSEDGGASFPRPVAYLSAQARDVIWNIPLNLETTQARIQVSATDRSGNRRAGASPIFTIRKPSPMPPILEVRLSFDPPPVGQIAPPRNVRADAIESSPNARPAGAPGFNLEILGYNVYRAPQPPDGQPLPTPQQIVSDPNNLVGAVPATATSFDDVIPLHDEENFIYALVTVYVDGSISSPSNLTSPVLPFRLRDWSAAGNAFQFRFRTAIGHSYTVQYKQSLNDPQWIELENFIGDGLFHTVLHPDAAASRAYRVRAD